MTVDFTLFEEFLNLKLDTFGYSKQMILKENMKDNRNRDVRQNSFAIKLSKTS